LKKIDNLTNIIYYPYRLSGSFCMKGHIILEEKIPSFSNIAARCDRAISLNKGEKYEESNIILKTAYDDLNLYWAETKFHIGLNYYALQQYTHAKECFLRVIAFLKKDPRKSGLIMLNESYLNLGLVSLDCPDKAKGYFSEAIRLGEQIGNTNAQLLGHFHLGILSKDINAGIEHLNKALSIAKQNQNRTLLLLCREKLGVLYTMKADYDNASQQFFHVFSSRQENLLEKSALAELNQLYGLCYIKKASKEKADPKAAVLYYKESRKHLAHSYHYYHPQQSNINNKMSTILSSILLSIPLLKLGEKHLSEKYTNESFSTLDTLPEQAQAFIISTLKQHLSDDLIKLLRIPKKYTALGEKITDLQDKGKNILKMLEMAKKKESKQVHSSLKEHKILESPRYLLEPFISLEYPVIEKEYKSGIDLFDNERFAASNHKLISAYEALRLHLAQVIFYIGSNYAGMDNAEKALFYYEKNRIILSKDKKNQQTLLINTLLEVSFCYSKKNDFYSATEALEEAIQIIEQNTPINVKQDVTAQDQLIVDATFLYSIYYLLGQCYLQLSNKLSSAEETISSSPLNKKYIDNPAKKIDPAIMKLGKIKEGVVSLQFAKKYKKYIERATIALVSAKRYAQCNEDLDDIDSELKKAELMIINYKVLIEKAISSLELAKTYMDDSKESNSWMIQTTPEVKKHIEQAIASLKLAKNLELPIESDDPEKIKLRMKIISQELMQADCLLLSNDMMKLFKNVKLDSKTIPSLPSNASLEESIPVRP
jgi:hypothetical protein